LRNFLKYRMVGLAALSLLFLLGHASSAQQRMTDKDIENTMKNLKEDSKRFQSSFNSSIAKSTIRKTSQEKDARGLVKSFEAQTETMLKVFQNSKKADTTLPGVLTSADQIDVVLKNVTLHGITTARWAKCKSELGLLATAFNMPYAGT
jgi:CRISPR/Cas system-associated endonuclease Cas3-HD